MDNGVLCCDRRLCLHSIGFNGWLNIMATLRQQQEDEVQRTSSILWNIIHEVSKHDMDLARKLDHAIADVKEASWRSGQTNGIDLAKRILLDTKKNSSSTKFFGGKIK